MALKESRKEIEIRKPRERTRNKKIAAKIGISGEKRFLKGIKNYRYDL